LGAVQIVGDGGIGGTTSKFRDAGGSWGAWPSDAETAKEVERSAQLRHVGMMRERFNPLPYRIGSVDNAAYDRMVDRYLQSAGPSETDDNRIYDAIASMMPRISEANTEINVEEELMQRATMLGGSDSFYNFTTVLHADANSLIGERANNAALERVMAAWLYIHGRYTSKAIANDATRFLNYQSLYIDIVSKGKCQFPPDLLARVERGYQMAAGLEPAIALEPFGLFEKGVNNLLSISKLRRDKGDYEGAVAELAGAVERLNESSWSVKATGRKPTWEQRRVARLLTDAYGMIGGHCRRLNQLERALASFERGSQFEKKLVFEIESTYNTVNWLVAKLELEPESYTIIAGDIDTATRLLEGHTKGRRNQDAWAWADLGTCQTLSSLDDKAEEALASFQKFAQLCDRGSIGAPLRVIETLHSSLLRAGLPQMANTQRVIDWLRALGSTST
jgi:hypothetical protein